MEHLTYEIDNHIAILKINRPKALNALNSGVLKEMLHFLQVDALHNKLKAVILTGEGDKAFISGADIKEMQTFNPQQMMEFSALGQDVANALETTQMLTIAAVNGYALGGGLEMALACDFIYVSEDATLGLPEAALGLIPGFGGTQRLARAIGPRMAKELILSARIISAKVALELGIANKVCAHRELLQKSLETAREIIKHPFRAVMGAKNAINCGMLMDFPKALEFERNGCVACFDTPERKAAMTAFISKRG